MVKQIGSVLVLSTVLLAGCATGRNYGPEMEGLNAKVENLQQQVQDKNKEIGQLKDQLRSLQSQLDKANRATKDAEKRLDSALNKLARKSGSESGSFDIK